VNALIYKPAILANKRNFKPPLKILIRRLKGILAAEGMFGSLILAHKSVYSHPETITVTEIK